MCWESYPAEGINPRSGKRVRATRRRLRVERDLPEKDDYGTFLRRLLAGAGALATD